jgi:hypothetical protein
MRLVGRCRQRSRFSYDREHETQERGRNQRPNGQKNDVYPVILMSRFSFPQKCPRELR